MKIIKLCSVLFLFVIFSSCLGKKDSEIDFKTQNPANGMISNTNWQVKSGICIRMEFLGIKSVGINLIDTIVDNLCDRDYRKIKRVTLTLSELELGEFTIKELKQQDEVNGVSFFDPEIDTDFLAEGRDAEEGVIKITEINEKQRIIKGSVTSKLDEQNFIDGEFVVKWCPKIE